MDPSRTMRETKELAAKTREDLEARVEESKFEASQALAKLAGRRLAKSLVAYTLKRYERGKFSIFDLRAYELSGGCTEVHLWQIASLWWLIKYRLGLWAFGRSRWTFASQATSPVDKLSPTRVHELVPDHPFYLYIR
ncbi:MAG: hypothetical protein Q4A34_03690 [Candidatus Saccharibacteria bacterium]|nr:hypothetical protein [Candidatus Saccharibacteria bacterium]